MEKIEVGKDSMTTRQWFHQLVLSLYPQHLAVAQLQFTGRYNMKITETIYDVVTQETTIVEHELTAEEIAERETAAADQAQRDAQEATKAAARQAVLDKLGLTADEIAALLP